MSSLFKRKFGLTDKGADDLVKASIASFFVYTSNILPAILLMFLLDELILGNKKSPSTYIIMSILVFLFVFIAYFIEYDAFFNTTYKESANLRIDIANTLSRLPLSYFSKHDLSDLSQTIMSDVERIEHALSHAMGKTIAFSVFFPIIALMLIVNNAMLGLIIIVPIIICFSLLFASKKIQLRENKKHFYKLRENSQAFQNGIELQQEIKSFGLNQKTKDDLYKNVEEEEKIHLISEFFGVIPILLSNFVLEIMIGLVIFFGSAMVIAGDISLLYFLGYLLFAIRMKESVDGINLFISELFYIDEKINRIKEIRDTKTQEGQDTQIENFDIQVEDVYFGYNTDSPVLKGVSFTANQGQTTALVGLSGCGKTSILRLISRLYDYDKGSIKIGGKDIKNISTSSLFSNISIVFQDVTLFNTSVMENIRLGRQNATDEEVLQASKLANCDEFIKNMPEGYNTYIGENGAKLSGGQRQRISIARAFLKNSPIIILDEIAAALDVDNEKKIQDSLNALIKNKTVIIISHRLKSIENVDKIVVLDSGKVETYGTHEQLLTESKIYNKLVSMSKLAENFKY